MPIGRNSDLREFGAGVASFVLPERRVGQRAAEREPMEGTAMRMWVVQCLVLLVSSVFNLAGAQIVRSQPLESVAAPKVAVPDEARLKTRIQDFYTALASKDARVMYRMKTPYVRAQMSFREYRKDWQLDEAWEAEPHTKVTVTLEQVCDGATPWTYPDGSMTLRYVLLLRGVEEQPDGSQRAAKFLEMWEYTNSEWYYGYPGEGDHCPSDESRQRSTPTPPEGVAATDVVVPDEARLKARIQEFYTARGSINARVMYDMQTPDYRSELSFQEYEKSIQWRYSEPAMKMTVELKRVCSCTPFERPYKMLRCGVLLDGVEEVSGGQRRAVKHSDLWEYADGEWFYVASFMSDQC